jgi:hypothetical protein
VIERSNDADLRDIAETMSEYAAMFVGCAEHDDEHTSILSKLD